MKKFKEGDRYIIFHQEIKDFMVGKIVLKNSWCVGGDLIFDGGDLCLKFAKTLNPFLFDESKAGYTYQDFNKLCSFKKQRIYLKIVKGQL